MCACWVYEQPEVNVQVSGGGKRKRCMDIKTLKGRQPRYAKAEKQSKTHY